MYPDYEGTPILGGIYFEMKYFMLHEPWQIIVPAG